MARNGKWERRKEYGGWTGIIFVRVTKTGEYSSREEAIRIYRSDFGGKENWKVTTSGGGGFWDSGLNFPSEQKALKFARFVMREDVIR